jgi:hypothetical protein
MTRLRTLLNHLGFVLALALGVLGLLVGLGLLDRQPVVGPAIVLIALAYSVGVVYRGARPIVSPARRLLLAFFVAPLLPVLISAWMSHLNHGNHPISMFILIGAMFYAVEIVIGLPAYLLFRRRQHHLLWAYALAGFCILLLPALSALLYRCFEKACEPFEVVYNATWLGLLGAVTAAIFWLIARPGRSAPPARSSLADQFD